KAGEAGPCVRQGLVPASGEQRPVDRLVDGGDEHLGRALAPGRTPPEAETLGLAVECRRAPEDLTLFWRTPTALAGGGLGGLGVGVADGADCAAGLAGELLQRVAWQVPAGDGADALRAGEVGPDGDVDVLVRGADITRLSCRRAIAHGVFQVGRL